MAAFARIDAGRYWSKSAKVVEKTYYEFMKVELSEVVDEAHGPLKLIIR